MTPEKKAQVLKRLNGPSRLEANKAGCEILADGDPELVRPVIAVLRHGHRVYNRVEAAYTLGSMRGAARTIALERTLANKSENPAVRAFAAEALLLGHRSESHRVLLRMLKDPSAQVRFWCAYALGEMHERKALPILRRLAAQDKRIVKGWRSVSKESADAIANIESGHRGRCAFCTSER